MFLAFPLAFKGRVVQYVGRLLRIHAGKHHVELHDYVDVRIPVLDRMHAKRLPAYATLGFDIPKKRPRTAAPRLRSPFDKSVGSPSMRTATRATHHSHKRSKTKLTSHSNQLSSVSASRSAPSTSNGDARRGLLAVITRDSETHRISLLAFRDFDMSPDGCG